MDAPAVEFEIDPDAPGDEQGIVESLVAVLLSARERRAEREQAEQEQEARGT